MKKTKKFLCLLLSLIMLLSLSGTALAASPTQTCPVIYVPGFDSSDIYADTTDTSTLISLPDGDALLEYGEKTLMPALVTYSADGDVDALALKLSLEMNKLLEDWFLEGTGDAKEGSGVIYNKTPSSVSATSNLVFRYDWRCDPLVAADELNDYINHIVSVSGCDKVALSVHSLGSCVVLSYLQKYGNDKVSAIVYDTPACNGVAVIGNLLTGKLEFDSDAIAYFVESLLGEDAYEGFTASIVDFFNIAGIPELITLFADSIIGALAPVIYKETIAPLFGCWPSMWAMLPDDKIDDAKAYIFDELLKDQDTTVLEARIDLYNTTVRANRESLLKSFDAVGNFAVISRHGSPSFPLTDASKLIGDTVIETRASSLGATTANVGKHFSDEELEGKNAEYISPDKTIDASTCLFPEKTWFINNITHNETAFTRGYHNIFLFAENELTCDTSEIDRFSYYDRANGTLVKDESVPEVKKEVPIIDRLVNFFKNLAERIADFFKAMFRK